MFAVAFMERIAAISVDITLEPVANMISNTVDYIVNSPRNNEIVEPCVQSVHSKLVWDHRRNKYVHNHYLPVCDKV